MKGQVHHPPEGMFIFQKTLWRPHKVDDQVRGQQFWRIDGPFCGKCRTPLDFNNGQYSKEASCPNPSCLQTISFEPYTLDELNRLVDKVFESKRNEKLPIYSLDLPPGRVSDKSEDNTYWVEARIGQKDGKKMAVVYFGEKKKHQSKKDYTQLFIDFDDEQIRFDKSNQHPTEIISQLKVTFDKSNTTVEKE